MVTVSSFLLPALVSALVASLTVSLFLYFQYRRLKAKIKPSRLIWRGLSAREYEVLDLVARGMTNDQISVVTKISTQTVKNHVSAVFHKLNCDNRTAAAVIFAQSKHKWYWIFRKKADGVRYRQKRCLIESTTPDIGGDNEDR